MAKNSKEPSGKITIEIGVELHKLLRKHLKNTGIVQNFFVKELISNALLETEKNIKTQQITAKNITKTNEDISTNPILDKINKIKGE